MLNVLYFCCMEKINPKSSSELDSFSHSDWKVLVDRRDDTHIMAMLKPETALHHWVSFLPCHWSLRFKPSGWATCSTPQWEGHISTLSMLAMCGLTKLIPRTWRQLNSTCVVLLQRAELTKLSCRIQAFDLDQGSHCSTLPSFGQRDLWYCCTKLSHKVREAIYFFFLIKKRHCGSHMCRIQIVHMDIRAT